MGERPPAGRRATAPPLDDELGEAMVLGMCVRNAMEGTIHGGELGDRSLTDEQMAVLNPIVRNAIATGLHAEEHYFSDKASRAYLDFQRRLVPKYWEPPVLLDDYTELWPFFASRDDEPVARPPEVGQVDRSTGSGHPIPRAEAVAGLLSTSGPTWGRVGHTSPRIAV